MFTLLTMVFLNLLLLCSVGLLLLLTKLTHVKALVSKRFARTSCFNYHTFDADVL